MKTFSCPSWSSSFSGTLSPLFAMSTTLTKFTHLFKIMEIFGGESVHCFVSYHFLNVLKFTCASFSSQYSKDFAMATFKAYENVIKFIL